MSFQEEDFYSRVLNSVKKYAIECGDLANDFCWDRKNGKQTLKIEIKSDLSPVTQVDKLVNEMLCSKLAEDFPECTVIGEESEILATKAFDFGKGKFIVVDPIDGTKEFIKNSGGWSTMIGLVEDGIATFGLVYAPHYNKIWYAIKGRGAYCVERDYFTKIEKPAQKIKTTLERFEKDPKFFSELIFMSSKNTPEPPTDLLFKNFGILSDHRRAIGSFGLKTSIIAEGNADIYLFVARGAHIWDIAGPSVILCEAGGTCGNLWLDIENNKTMRFSGTNTKQDYVILSTGGEMLFQEISKVYKEIIHSSNLSELI